ncbi:hypothetical protein TKK_0015891 [Trichogramma kaykai]|uniref:RING-type domain-containing protein n=1 Tax=Trichogramma kaykai TaxID=54128 RepID=A0ABD2W9F1_9HYME
MSVHYKFKSTLDYYTVSFDGLYISVADLKKNILQQQKIGKKADFELLITDAQTKEGYHDDSTLIPKNSSLVVSRVPLTVAQKRIRERTELSVTHNINDQTEVGKSVDLTKLEGSELDKINLMMSQSTQEYQTSNWVKIRGSSQTGEVPPNYRCHKCHRHGHWIKDCPISNEVTEIKKSTGIPRSFMVPVEGPSVPGAMMTPGGTYAVPAIDHQAYKEGKKERPPFTGDPQTDVEQTEIPKDMICPICKDILTDAVMIPCCGKPFCDECIRTYLLESEDHQCPDCEEKDVSPENMIPSRYLRNAVSRFKNETGYKRLLKRSIEEAAQRTVPEIVTEKISVSPPANAEPNSTEESPVHDKKTPLEENDVSDEKSTSEEVTNEVVKLQSEGDGLDEIPPPPGTEPALLPKRNSDQSWRDSGSDTVYDDEQTNQYESEKKRSYASNNAVSSRNSTQAMNARHVTSPAHNHTHSTDYSAQDKSYLPPMNADNRYHAPPPMPYDGRRSTEDRAGTPTVDEPHLHPQQQPMYPPGDERVTLSHPYPPTVPTGPPMMPDPYMVPPAARMMYPPQPGYGPPPPPPPQRYDNRAPMYPQGPPPVGYRHPPPPRHYAPRPMRGSYRAMSHMPPGMGRPIHNGTTSSDPLFEAFMRNIREKDERDRRLGKHRVARRSRSPSRSYSRSRSRSRTPRRRLSSPLGRAASRSRSPPPKRRIASRSPPPSKRVRSRTPKKRRSRSGSFRISRSRSYSRSLSPRGSLSRERDRKGKRPRDTVAPYRSPIRSPPRYHKERDRTRQRSPFGTGSTNANITASGSTYYDPNTVVPSALDHFVARNDVRTAPQTGSHRYIATPAIRTTPAAAVVPIAPAPMPTQLLPPPPNLIVAAAGPQVPVQQIAVTTPVLPGVIVPPTAAATTTDKSIYDSYNRYPRSNHYAKRFDDVAPPGTEGYYDLPPPGIEQSTASKRPSPKEREVDRFRDDRSRDRERDRERDRRRSDEKYKVREREHDRDHHHRRRSPERKRKRSSSPRYDEKPEKKEKKDKKDRKDKKKSEDKDKKKKKKKEKKAAAAAAAQKEATQAVAAITAAALLNTKPIRVKKEPIEPTVVIKLSDPNKPSGPATHVQRLPKQPVVVKQEPIDELLKKSVKDVPKSLAETLPESLLPMQIPVATKALSLAETLPESLLPMQIPPATKPLSLADTLPESLLPMQIPADKPAMFDEPLRQTSPTPPRTAKSPTPVKEAQIELVEPVTKIEPLSPKQNEAAPNPDSSSCNQNYDEDDKYCLQLNASTENLYDGLVTDSEISTTSDMKKKDDDANEEGEIVESERDETEKRDEFLAPLPELSKWERDETEKPDEVVETTEIGEMTTEENGKDKVTTEVLKRAENAIFQKAINSIRPIEIKKISDSRKVLYQNPEPKVLDSENERKSVNVTITVAKNERNVELSTPDPLLKKISKTERVKSSKATSQLSPSRVSIKERLGEKVEEESKQVAVKHVVLERTRESIKSERSKSPRMRSKEGRVSDTTVMSNPERKVFVEDRKRKTERPNRNRVVLKPDSGKVVKSDRIGRTPPLLIKVTKNDEDSSKESKKDKKVRDDKKRSRKESRRSRSRSRDRKKRKEKKSKKDRSSSKRSGKDKESIKDSDDEKDGASSSVNKRDSSQKKLTSRTVSVRRRSFIEEAHFEPNYSASSSEDETSSSESVYSDSESSVESHKKRKRKHKKRKKVKARHSSESDEYSDSSESSSEEEKHKKKKKSKSSKSRKSNKKKRSKHK